MAGDYEFLCNMYGISGASGKKLPIKLFFIKTKDAIAAFGVTSRQKS